MPATAPRREGRETHSERKRRDIVDAAISAFQEHGFQNTSMDRVAALAGVSKRTVYNHFAGKEALYEYINERLCEEILAASELAYDPVLPLERQLREMADREAAAMASPRFQALARCTLSAWFECPELAARAWQRLQATEKGLVHWLRAAAADGRLQVDDPRATARRLSAMLKEFLFWPQVLFGAPPLKRGERERAIGEAVRLLIEGHRPA